MILVDLANQTQAALRHRHQHPHPHSHSHHPHPDVVGNDDIFDTLHLFETLPRDADGWVVIPATEPFQEALALLNAARHWLALALKLNDQVAGRVVHTPYQSIPPYTEITLYQYHHTQK